jgi:putative aldouronate transport system substrate-binding protein
MRQKVNTAFLFVSVLLLAVSQLSFGGGGGQQSASASGAARITVEVFDRGTDGGRTRADNNAWTQWIQEKVKKDLNIDVTFHAVPRWSENTDIVNLMASGSAPDLCCTYNGGMISSFRDQGGIMDLAPHIEALLPDMKKLLGEDDVFPGQYLIYRRREPATGRVYSVPSYIVERTARKNVFIRKDWLDTLGLPLPRTTREFHDALVAFRDRDPGNVGRSNVIPFGQSADARWGFSPFIYPYYDPKVSDRDRWVIGSGERSIMMPGYKDGLRMMNAWYNEGLIFRDFPLMKDTDEWHNIIRSGFVGAFAGNWDYPWRTDYRILEDMRINNPKAEYVPVDCIQSPDGITRKDISDKVGFYIFVPGFSKNLEAALKYLNWLSIYENYHYLQIGIQGVNHELVNGVPRTLSTPAGHAWFQNSANNIDFTMPMNGIEMGSSALNARVIALGYGNTPPEVIANAMSVSVSNGRPPVVYQATTTKDGIYAQTLEDKVDALIAQAVTASPGDFDRIWDAGVRDYLSSGGQEVIDERASLWK